MLACSSVVSVMNAALCCTALPGSGDPADGADGADVYVVCDPALDNLLHLHKRKQWFGPRGAKGNPAVGSSGPKRNAQIKKAVTPALEIPVPPGTVIRRKSNGQVRLLGSCRWCFALAGGCWLQPRWKLLVASC